MSIINPSYDVPLHRSHAADIDEYFAKKNVNHVAVFDSLHHYFPTMPDQDEWAKKNLKDETWEIMDHKGYSRMYCKDIIDKQTFEILFKTKLPPKNPPQLTEEQKNKWINKKVGERMSWENFFKCPLWRTDLDYWILYQRMGYETWDNKWTWVYYDQRIFLHTILSWLVANCTKEFFQGVHNVVAFESKEDATLFKMTWC